MAVGARRNSDSSDNMNELWRQIHMGLNPGSNTSCVAAVNMLLKFAKAQLFHY